MSRLKKVALMSSEIFNGTLKQLGEKGRLILKNIEDYKFSLEQAARIVSNDNSLSQRLVEKKKELDTAAGQVYSIVFEIENIDITNEFQQQQQFVNNPDLKNQNNDNMQQPMNSQDSNQLNNETQNIDESLPIGGGSIGEDTPSNTTPGENDEEQDEETPSEENVDETVDETPTDDEEVK